MMKLQMMFSRMMGVGSALVVLAALATSPVYAAITCAAGNSTAGPVRIDIDADGNLGTTGGINPTNVIDLDTPANILPGGPLPCGGAGGNDNPTTVKTVADLLGVPSGPGGWDLLAKIDTDGGPTTGLIDTDGASPGLSITCGPLGGSHPEAEGGGGSGAQNANCNPADDSGTWTWRGTTPDVLPWKDIGIVLKAGNGFAVFFVDVSDYITSGAALITGTWADTKDLSHLAIYGSGVGPTVTNSEPASAMLLAVGLLGLVAARHRRRRLAP